MRWILENDITGHLENTFCVEMNVFGERKSHELKPNGDNIPVTEDNKKEYVKLYVKWRFLQGIEAQFLSLSKVREILKMHEMYFMWNFEIDLLFQLIHLCTN